MTPEVRPGRVRKVGTKFVRATPEPVKPLVLDTGDDDDVQPSPLLDAAFDYGVIIAALAAFGLTLWFAVRPVFG